MCFGFYLKKRQNFGTSAKVTTPWAWMIFKGICSRKAFFEVFTLLSECVSGIMKLHSGSRLVLAGELEEIGTGSGDLEPWRNKIGTEPGLSLICIITTSLKVFTTNV
ncbi:hypothetical protein Zmor_006514 [Zophobas morio]|uniref:Uncharacterized protein n=1 Tax=Zophobas morio TaxID=2755281 RepID=A0AA38IXD1_9CUCU|nr:hypothetical protein Zmor_006514 [Zophobas morio]